MIRRDCHDEQGSVCWLQIDQTDHARISGELAAAWGGSGFARLDAWPGLVEAIAAHDDGWAEWDKSPDVDPASGAPRAFTEMPMPDALAIWRRSIDSAVRFGPLAAYVVSGHFLTLLNHAMARPTEPQPPAVSHDYLGERRREEILHDESLGQAHRHAWSAADPLATGFRKRYEADQQRWLAELSQSEGTRPADAELGLAYLQMFDWISLWLCCAARESPETFATPDGPEITIAPRDSRFRVAPWPFHVDAMTLKAPARRVAARRYASRDELARTTAETTVLTFALVRS